jgi:hypothetical protein
MMSLVTALTSESAVALLTPCIFNALHDETPEVQVAVLESLARVAPVLSNVEVRPAPASSVCVLARAPATSNNAHPFRSSFLRRL